MGCGGASRLHSRMTHGCDSCGTHLMQRDVLVGHGWQCARICMASATYVPRFVVGKPLVKPSHFVVINAQGG